LAVPLGNSAIAPDAVSGDCRALYDAMGLNRRIGYEVFEDACHGYAKIDNPKELMTIIDFSKPSTEERLFVIDMVRQEMVLASHVAHGRGSGDNYATSFGNENGSHKSSLGFYLTGDSYQGRNGYSMRLHGLEDGINDKAYERAVVVHGAAYADPSVCSTGGRLGRSFGCPALPRAVNKKVIDLIKDGSVLFIYGDDSNYLAQSKFI
jgi:hypothetical protein